MNLSSINFNKVNLEISLNYDTGFPNINFLYYSISYILSTTSGYISDNLELNNYFLFSKTYY